MRQGQRPSLAALHHTNLARDVQTADSGPGLVGGRTAVLQAAWGEVSESVFGWSINLTKLVYCQFPGDDPRAFKSIIAIVVGNVSMNS